MKNDNKSNVFVIVLFGFIAVCVLLFPKIYSVLEKTTLPEVEKTKEAKEEKVIDDNLLDSVHYPIMLTNIHFKDTYYTQDVFKISDMSNDDILYNAFIDIYEGYIKNNEFNAEYIDLRIKNILGKNVKYTLKDFEVPSGSPSNYIGKWKYDSKNSKFTYSPYYGNNNYQDTYYVLEDFIKAGFNNKDLIIYKYIGFAKVSSNNYIIYKDANMTNELTTGTFTNIEDLNNVFKKINNEDKKIYKYIFKDSLCSYNEYCLYEGRWVNEL